MAINVVIPPLKTAGPIEDSVDTILLFLGPLENNKIIRQC